jgi:AbrB family looped-hinge helix DNA binding protein
METATLSSKFQLCIPKAIRKELHLKAGQKFVCISKNNGLYLVPKKDINDIRGILIGANVKNYRDRQDRI